ncbi:hypothetical protein Tco_1557451, partial [Tanacetum coccineum]
MMTQDLRSIPGEHVCPANRGENTFSQAALPVNHLSPPRPGDGKNKEPRNFVDTLATKTCQLQDQDQQDQPTYRYNFKATATDGTTNGQFTFFVTAGDEAAGHPCSKIAQKYNNADPHEIPTAILSIEGQTSVAHIIS